jgi:hypothetical protein
VTILSDALQHLVRSMPTIKSIFGTAIEAERVHGDRWVIANWYSHLARRIEGATRQFVLNMDETDCN